jgi:hypothetical protein
LSQDNDLLSLDNASLSLDNAPLSQDNDLLSLDNASLSQDNDPLSLDNDLLSLDNDLLSLDNAPLSQDNASLSQDNDLLSLDNASLSQDNDPPSLDYNTKSCNFFPPAIDNASFYRYYTFISIIRRYLTLNHRSDWLPGTRDGQLAMAKNWNVIIPAHAAAWGIPNATAQELAALTAAAETALNTAKNETTRTPVATAQCRASFDALVAAMRDIKKRYFYIPPLTEADLVSLGLKVPDPTLTPSGKPAAQVMVETYLVGRHELGIKIVYVTGSAADPANKGYRIWYSVVAPGETPPANPAELRKSFFTKRKKDVIAFDYGESGKTAHFAVQVENDGKKGEWGPLVSALIP